MLKVIKYTNANAIEATWLYADGKQLLSHAYSDVQMQMFRDDVARYGGNIAEHESLILDIAAHIQPPIPPSIAERKALKQAQIDALEASQYMGRSEREGWLAMVLAQAAAQGMTEPILYTKNIFYKKLKDIDKQVTDLRAELKAIV